jgi:hypothetical protein
MEREPASGLSYRSAGDDMAVLWLMSEHQDFLIAPVMAVLWPMSE